MKVTVHKSEVKGKVSAPSSKSMTIRGLMCAALIEGMSEIVHPLVSEDTDTAAAVLGQIGVSVKKEDDLWRIMGGTLRASPQDLFCGESATTLRFMMAVCALIPGRHRLVGGPSLSKRPVKSLVEAMKMLGIKVSTEGKDTPPVTIEGGALKGDTTELPGDISSQFISALLLIAPFARREMTIRLTTPLTSKPYVLMTLWCLKQFGIDVRASPDRFVVLRQKYQPARLEVEGDWSSASYFLALGAVSGGIEVGNLSAASLQGDRVILDFLRDMGAGVKTAGDSVTVSRGDLRAINADLSDCIDLLPTVAVLAALAKGKSEFTGIDRARIKESDRVTAVKENLQKMGVIVDETNDRLIIAGLKTPVSGKAIEPVVIDSYGDHRIAMAFGVLGAAVGGVTIKGAESVAKTFPTFWDMLKNVGVRMETHAE
jgi:3-phosphoshikimate 1-carboxyvinyltransferase